MTVLLRIALLVLLTSCPLAAADALPKVVLIGDSIRLSYAPTVIEELKGKAQVVSSRSNGGDSNNVLKHLANWAIKENPDVVHFNCGIHDTKFFKEQQSFQVTPEKYEANLREIVKRIRAKTSAVVIFATTTPILDERALSKRRGRAYALTGRAVERYNAIALRVMAELKVPINDLNKVVGEGGVKELLDADGVHLTRSARELLGRRVAEFVKGRLKKP